LSITEHGCALYLTHGCVGTSVIARQPPREGRHRLTAPPVIPGGSTAARFARPAAWREIKRAPSAGSGLWTPGITVPRLTVPLGSAIIVACGSAERHLRWSSSQETG